MSFFDNNKTVGLMLIIVGLINIIMGIAQAVDGVINEDTGKLIAAAVCFGIASLIFGILILGYGLKVRRGPNDQSDTVSGLVRVIGVATILQAIFIAIGSYLNNQDSIGGAIVGAIIQLILGIILIWVAGKISGKNKNVISKIVWVIAVVVFLILAITSFLRIFDNLDFGNLKAILILISSICMFLVYIYCFVAMLSKDIKTTMGISI